MDKVKINKSSTESLEEFLDERGFELHPSFQDKKERLKLLLRLEETLKELDLPEPPRKK